LGHREERKEGSGRWRKGEEKKRRKRKRGGWQVSFEREREDGDDKRGEKKKIIKK
jgi:hypothetical protein